MSTPPAGAPARAGSKPDQQARPFRPFLSKLANSFGYASSSSGASSSSSSGDEASGAVSDAELSDASDSEDAARSGLTNSSVALPQCWGHRGVSQSGATSHNDYCASSAELQGPVNGGCSATLQASAAYPENTLASFEQAIQDGAEGIESDVHVSLDGTIVMFHDAYLNRTTNGKGLISKQVYKGGIDGLRTTKTPAQRICTFAETLFLLSRPEAQHVVLNVDVKLDNDPEVLFKLMDQEIRTFDNWQTKLAPRLILGLWHAKYIEPAQRLLPYCRLAHIGISPAIARKYFWKACSAFSLNYSTLVGREGEKFRAACKAEGKDLYVWTVNNRREMIQATKWGVKAILTDRTADFLNLRGQMTSDWDKVSAEVDWSHAWSNFYYFTPVNSLYMAWESFLMQRTAGPMVLPSAAAAAKVPTVSVTPANDTSVQ